MSSFENDDKEVPDVVWSIAQIIRMFRLNNHLFYFHNTFSQTVDLKTPFICRISVKCGFKLVRRDCCYRNIGYNKFLLLLCYHRNSMLQEKLFWIRFVSAMTQHLDTLFCCKTDKRQLWFKKKQLSLLSYRQGPSGGLCQLNQTTCGLLSQTFFRRLNTAVH